MTERADDLLPGAPPNPRRARGPRIARFLSKTEVAEYLGLAAITSLVKVELPPHDAEIGKVRGWFPSTIDAWQAARPGKGRRGARIGQRRSGETVMPNSKVDSGD